MGDNLHCDVKKMMISKIYHVYIPFINGSEYTFISNFTRFSILFNGLLIISLNLNNVSRIPPPNYFLVSNLLK